MQTRLLDVVIHIGSGLFIFTWIRRLNLGDLRQSVFWLAATLAFWGLFKVTREIGNHHHSLMRFGTPSNALTLSQLNEGSDIAVKVGHQTDATFARNSTTVRTMNNQLKILALNDPTQSGHYSAPGSIDATLCRRKTVRIITKNEVTCSACRRYMDRR